ncbi:MAG: hypothetical protein HQK70_14535 [Desulfamplus sp.]|nr:hypothetical protein [Desulfamplus sp.]
MAINYWGTTLFFASQLHGLFQVDETEGGLAADLANTVDRIPTGLPVQVGIGVQPDIYILLIIIPPLEIRAVKF